LEILPPIAKIIMVITYVVENVKAPIKIVNIKITDLLVAIKRMSSSKNILFRE
jgi:hypothetical protein